MDRWQKNILAREQLKSLPRKTCLKEELKIFMVKLVLTYLNMLRWLFLKMMSKEMKQ